MTSTSNGPEDQNPTDQISGDAPDVEDSIANDSEPELPKIVSAGPDDVDGIKIKAKPAVVAPSIVLKKSGVSATLDDEDAKQTQVSPAVQPQSNQRRSGMLIKRSASPAPPGGGNGGGNLPALATPDGPQPPFVERYKKPIIAAAVIGSILLLFATFLLIKSLTTPESQKILTESASSVDNVTGELADANDLADLRQAARTAARARNFNAQLTTRTNQNLSGDEKVQVANILAANAKLLDSYSALAEATPRNFISSRGKVARYQRNIENGTRSLDSAATSAAAADVEPQFDASLVDSAADQADEVLENANTKLTAWSAKRRRLKAAKAKFTREAASLNAIDARLFDAREDTESFANRSGTCSGGRTDITSMQSTREGIASSASAASAGPLLATAKSHLVSATSKAVDAMTTLDQIWVAWIPCDSGPINNQPSYQAEFMPLSRQVQSSVDSFKSAMSSATTEANSKYRVPKMPEV